MTTNADGYGDGDEAAKGWGNGNGAGNGMAFGYGDGGNDGGDGAGSGVSKDFTQYMLVRAVSDINIKVLIP